MSQLQPVVRDALDGVAEFLFFEELRSFDDAVFACKEFDENARLASIRSVEEFNFVADMVNGSQKVAKPSSFWIGSLCFSHVPYFSHENFPILSQDFTIQGRAKNQGLID